MKTTIFAIFLFACMAMAPASYELPKGWFKAGSDPGKYDMGVDKGSGQDGKNAATIKSNTDVSNGFGTLMQNCKPDKYIGKRIRMTAYVKSDNIKGWAGLWLRVDQNGSNNRLAFDNMEDRAIKGTTNWTKYEIVLDVPEGASNIAFGALISGTGQIWFDQLSFEVVDSSVKTTGKTNSITFIPSEPTNLDFQE
ncbi:MAG TPA: hypothetical protein VK783_00075 [Bacteroidia bacterium]|jgi:hypothetical protein|nr:hypothetical protein [Bacteroidia bacterium]